MDRQSGLLLPNFIHRQWRYPQIQRFFSESCHLSYSVAPLDFFLRFAGRQRYQSTLVKLAWQLFDDSHLSKRRAVSTRVGNQRLSLYSQLLVDIRLPSTAPISPNQLFGVFKRSKPDFHSIVEPLDSLSTSDK